MNVAERARQAYRNLTKKQDERETLDTIQASVELKSLLDHKGWLRVERYMERQREGSEQLLDIDLGSLSIINIPKLFNTFLKYLYVVQERRAYKKIRTFVRLTIQTGEKYAAKRAKAEAEQSKKQ